MTTRDFRCCMCGYRFDHEVTPCVVCERMICTGCAPQRDLLAIHYDRDAQYFLQRAEAAFWTDEDPKYVRMIREASMQTREMIEGVLDTRMQQAMRLKDPKRSALRILKLARGQQTGFAAHIDRVFAARILALDLRGELVVFLPPLMRTPDGAIVPFEPAADLPMGLPPMIRRALHPPTEEEEGFDDGPQTDRTGPQHEHHL